MTRRCCMALTPVALLVAVVMIAACGQPAIQTKAPGTWRARRTDVPTYLVIKAAAPSKYGGAEYDVSYSGARQRLYSWGGEGASLHGGAIYLWGENRMSAPAHVITYDARADQLLVTHWGAQGETVTFVRARK